MAPSSTPGLLWTAIGLGVALSALGCGKQLETAPVPAFKFSVRVDSDPNRPLAGAKVLHQDKEVGVTQADGRALVALRGNEGDQAQLVVKCPETNQQPPPIVVALRRLADGRVPEYAISCPPLVRRVVVGIRAEGGANLPVVFLGNVVARTDGSGAAHFALDVKPGEQFEVQLKTDENPKLLPKNPARSFVMPPRDDVVVFNQTFSLEKTKKVYHFVAKPRGPRPVGGPAKL
ncbi:MAG TPA: hypothetical protein PLR99_02175 [Polyangiaceae bacterium]|jgi:hypothetical protein|nr:hypothetical protein [Polyangiaceae bacterium]